MSDWFVLIIMILTTFRLTWLITNDTIPLVRIPREWLLAKAVHSRRSAPAYDTPDDDPRIQVQQYRGRWYYLAELVTCPWCVSVWMAGVVALLTVLLFPTGLSMPWLWFGATAGGAALLAHLVSTTQE